MIVKTSINWYDDLLQPRAHQPYQRARDCFPGVGGGVPFSGWRYIENSGNTPR